MALPQHKFGQRLADKSSKQKGVKGKLSFLEVPPAPLHHSCLPDFFHQKNNQESDLSLGSMMEEGYLHQSDGWEPLNLDGIVTSSYGSNFPLSSWSIKNSADGSVIPRSRELTYSDYSGSIVSVAKSKIAQAQNQIYSPQEEKISDKWSVAFSDNAVKPDVQDSYTNYTNSGEDCSEEINVICDNLVKREPDGCALCYALQLNVEEARRMIMQLELQNESLTRQKDSQTHKLEEANKLLHDKDLEFSHHMNEFKDASHYFVKQMEKVEATERENYCLRMECNRLAENLAQATRMKGTLKQKLIELLQVAETKLQDQMAISEKLVTLLSYSWDNIELRKVLYRNGMDQLPLGKIALSAMKHSERSTSIESEYDGGWSDSLGSSSFPVDLNKEVEVASMPQTLSPSNESMSVSISKTEFPKEVAIFDSLEEISIPDVDKRHIDDQSSQSTDFVNETNEISPTTNIELQTSFNQSEVLEQGMLSELPGEKSYDGVEAENELSSTVSFSVANDVPPVSEKTMKQKENKFRSYDSAEWGMANLDVYFSKQVPATSFEPSVMRNGKTNSFLLHPQKRWTSFCVDGKLGRSQESKITRASFIKKKQSSYSGSNKIIYPDMLTKDAFSSSQATKKVPTRINVSTQVTEIFSKSDSKQEKDVVVTQQPSLIDRLQQTPNESLYESSRRLRLEQEAKTRSVGCLPKIPKGKPIGYCCTPSSSLQAYIKSNPSPQKLSKLPLPSFATSKSSNRRTIATEFSESDEKKFDGVFSQIHVFGLDVLGENHNLKPLESTNDLLNLMQHSKKKTSQTQQEGSFPRNKRATLPSEHHSCKSSSFQELPPFPYPSTHMQNQSDLSKLLKSLYAGNYQYSNNLRQPTFSYLYSPQKHVAAYPPLSSLFGYQYNDVPSSNPRRNYSIVYPSLQTPMKHYSTQARSTYLPPPIQPVSTSLYKSSIFPKYFSRNNTRSTLSFVNPAIPQHSNTYPQHSYESLKAFPSLNHGNTSTINTQRSSSSELNTFDSSQKKLTNQQSRMSLLIPPRNLLVFFNPHNAVNVSVVPYRKSLQ